MRQKTRLSRVNISPWNIGILHRKNPWVPLCWSAAMPGLGHFCHGFYLKGSIFMAWELLLNFLANINLSILYTFTGQFEQAANVITLKWAIFYGAVYSFTMYDSYRSSSQNNILASLEKNQVRRSIPFAKDSSLGLNYLDRTNPWLAAVWSSFFSGFGHLYNGKIIKGLIILAWLVAILYFSNLGDAIIATLLGDFQRARQAVDYQWLLFFPSIYVFSIWDACNDSVEMNKLFAEEQKQHLRKKYGPNVDRAWG